MKLFTNFKNDKFQKLCNLVDEIYRFPLLKKL